MNSFPPLELLLQSMDRNKSKGIKGNKKQMKQSKKKYLLTKTSKQLNTDNVLLCSCNIYLDNLFYSVLNLFKYLWETSILTQMFKN